MVFTDKGSKVVKGHFRSETKIPKIPHKSIMRDGDRDHISTKLSH